MSAPFQGKSDFGSRCVKQRWRGSTRQSKLGALLSHCYVYPSGSAMTFQDNLDFRVKVGNKDQIKNARIMKKISDYFIITYRPVCAANLREMCFLFNRENITAFLNMLTTCATHCPQCVFYTSSKYCCIVINRPKPVLTLINFS